MNSMTVQHTHAVNASTKYRLSDYQDNVLHDAVIGPGGECDNTELGDAPEVCKDPGDSFQGGLTSTSYKDQDIGGPCSDISPEVANVNQYIPSLLADVLRELKAHSISDASQRRSDPLSKVETWVWGLLSTNPPKIGCLPNVTSGISLVSRYLALPDPIFSLVYVNSHLFVFETKTY